MQAVPVVEEKTDLVQRQQHLDDSATADDDTLVFVDDRIDVSFHNVELVEAWVNRAVDVLLDILLTWKMDPMMHPFLENSDVVRFAHIRVFM
jgi:hypothetical protein